jgi:acyl-CoA thioesterase-1
MNFIPMIFMIDPRRVAAIAGVLIALATGCCVAAAAPVILVVGDSISAGYGIPADAGWTTLLQRRLAAEHLPYRVVNASISGDTTAGGRSRLPALLEQQHPAITIIELGGNDGLRGGSLDAMRANIDAMTASAQKAGSNVLLLGMQLPPNYGAPYVNRFASIYADVAHSRKAALVPFFFEGFADDSAMFQQDGVHPVASAQQRLLDNVWPQLRPLLSKPK